ATPQREIVSACACQTLAISCTRFGGSGRRRFGQARGRLCLRPIASHNVASGVSPAKEHMHADRRFDDNSRSARTKKERCRVHQVDFGGGWLRAPAAGRVYTTRG